jgi:hypothetical protein
LPPLEVEQFVSPSADPASSDDERYEPVVSDVALARVGQRFDEIVNFLVGEKPYVHSRCGC